MHPLKPHLQRVFQQRVEEERALGHLHPVDLADYAPGSPRLERLYLAMEQSKQTWPLNGHEGANV